MSKKRKDKPVQELKVEYVSYQAFFSQSLAKGLVKPWQEKEVRVFFQDLGLSDKETTDTYLTALSKY